ncbi:MAG TPA: UrcA family protein [Rhizomicrobium sp.]|nr:UrcA family protein [Rhizomicrobium sp.]
MTVLSLSRLACGVALIAFAAAPALAQDTGYDGESVIVTAPRFHVEGNLMRNVPEKVSLSAQVRTDDLDLNSWRGRQTLRWRVRDAAQGVCTQLYEAYPFRQQPGTSCYRKALQDGMLRANAAIRDARDRRYED